MTTWEYRILDEWRGDTEIDEDAMQELGNEGFELIAVVPSVGRRSESDHRFIFKRAVSSSTPMFTLPHPLS